jgi:hypothetical protein
LEKKKMKRDLLRTHLLKACRRHNLTESVAATKISGRNKEDFAVSKRYFVCAIFAGLLLSSQLWGQGAPFVLVTDLSGQQILSVNTTTLTVTPIFTLAGSNFEGIVYGPEGSGFTGNKIYVCDPTADKIYRLSLTITSGQPTAAALDGGGIVYAGTGTVQNAQCGRFTSTGDFLVTSKSSGGVWKFAGLGASPTSLIPAIPTQIVSGTHAEGDLTQANNSDLLIVDITSKIVLKSVLPSSGSVNPTTFITKNLTQPTAGIARRNDGKIYVADGGGQNNIKVFTPDGNPDSLNSVCGTFSDVPQFIKVAADGTLYVATSNANGSGLSNGKLYRVDTSSCITTLVADIGQSGNPPAIGVAIPPTSTSKTKTTVLPLPGFLNFNYGFSQFVASNVANPCTTSVTETQTHLADLQNLIPNGGAPVPFLGEAGFGTLFNFPPDGCTPSSGGLFDFAIAGFASGETNPRIVECPSTGQCEVGLDGFYPISEAIPGDCCIIKKPGGGSSFFVINLPFSGGQFCGFQNPSNDSLTNTTDPLNPNVPTATGNTWAIKFKIAKATAACSSTKTSDYITDALEVLSLIRVRDAQGNVTNDIVTPLSSTSTYVNPCANLPGAPICVENGNKQYSFSLNTNGLQSGVWNFSLTSLTNNISVKWNFFKK